MGKSDHFVIQGWGTQNGVNWSFHYICSVGFFLYCAWWQALKSGENDYQVDACFSLMLCFNIGTLVSLLFILVSIDIKMLV